MTSATDPVGTLLLLLVLTFVPLLLYIDKRICVVAILKLKLCESTGEQTQH